MDVTKLKNGREEATVLVTVTMATLKHLMKTKPIVLFEFVSKCRDSAHELFGCSGADLKALSLIDEGGTPHNSVKNIVLSAIEGEGLEMTIGDPRA